MCFLLGGYKAARKGPFTSVSHVFITEKHLHFFIYLNYTELITKDTIKVLGNKINVN